MPTLIPMDLWPRQEEWIHWVDASVAAQEDGLTEKSREIGFTWLCGGYALHSWLYSPGFKTTFGSRKEDYVDKIGEPDSIFEKIRMIMRSLPCWMMPPGFNMNAHATHMRIVHPVHNGTIRGESGDGIGRGGRSTLLIVDEAAHLERGERVDAASVATCDTRIFGSSVNGMGNMFARKRHDGSMKPRQIFRFHYTDDPRKTPEWAAKKQTEIEAHVWAAEYDIDYSASIEGICIPAKWVDAAVRLGSMVKTEMPTLGVAGLDVGAGGKNKSVFIARFGHVVLPPISWGQPDTIETARRGLEEAAKINFKRSDGYDCHVRLLNYDVVGVGVGVRDALRGHDKPNLQAKGVNVGEPPSDTKWPDGRESKQIFSNLKAEGWFLLRQRIKNSFELVLHMEGKDGGQAHPVEDCLILPPISSGPDAHALIGQLSAPKRFFNEKGLIIMESKADLAKRGIASTDHADALVLSMVNVKSLETWLRLAAA